MSEGLRIAAVLYLVSLVSSIVATAAETQDRIGPRLPREVSGVIELTASTVSDIVAVTVDFDEPGKPADGFIDAAFFAELEPGETKPSKLKDRGVVRFRDGAVVVDTASRQVAMLVPKMSLPAGAQLKPGRYEGKAVVAVQGVFSATATNITHEMLTSEVLKNAHLPARRK